MTSHIVRFNFDRANNASMKEKVFENPDLSLIDLKVGTVLEISFENDAYYADFKIDSKSVSSQTNIEGKDIVEHFYLLKYVPRTTRTKTEQEKIIMSKTDGYTDP
jgi:hypothetical protein